MSEVQSAPEEGYKRVWNLSQETEKKKKHLREVDMGGRML
jgi:hypothetical protein